MSDPLYITGVLRKTQQKSLAVGIIGVVISVLALLINRGQFMTSYLEAYLFWLGITLGSLVILMINNLLGGNWGIFVRPLLESASRLVPFMALLFIPILIGRNELFGWTRPGIFAGHPEYGHKEIYFGLAFFTARVVFYFALWSIIRFVMRNNPFKAASVAEKKSLQLKSGLGLVAMGFSMSFAGFDWVMSIDPLWYSNMFGLIFAVSELLTAWAFIVTMTILLKDRLAQANYPTQTLHDCGNLLLVFVMFWTYISFSQFLIMWAGKLPEEFKWYHARAVGGWCYVGYTILFLHFVVPFLLLLQRLVKRNPTPLLLVAILLLVMRMVDIVWWILPYSQSAVHPIQWPYFVVLAAIGGIWLFLFLSKLDAPGLLIVPPDPHVEVAGHTKRPAEDRPPQDRPRGEKKR